MMADQYRNINEFGMIVSTNEREKFAKQHKPQHHMATEKVELN